MPTLTRSVLASLLAVALSQALPALGADADADALDLQSAPQASADAAPGTRFFIEGALGSADQRYQSDNQNLARGSFDLNYSARLGAGWQGVFSDRLDVVSTTESGISSPVNSLREAYLSWQPDGGDKLVELGRVNLRYGPGYGYNPTDFFRDGSLRIQTTVNPFEKRENRLGTIMLRGQALWTDGSLSVAYSPKLADDPSSNGWSADLGATNNVNRGLVALSTKLTERVSTQLLAYQVQGSSPALGASATALLSDAAVAYAEFTRSSEPSLLSRALGLQDPKESANRFTGGLTYTTDGKLSVTAEYQYNGFALNAANLAALGATPSIEQAYLLTAQNLQELASREAYMIYVTQKDLGLKGLDLTAFVRVNAGDHSRLGWLELRQHWSRFDMALSYSQASGNASSEYGVFPYSRVLQLLGSYFF